MHMGNGLQNLVDACSTQFHLMQYLYWISAVVKFIWTSFKAVDFYRKDEYISFSFDHWPCPESHMVSSPRYFLPFPFMCVLFDKIAA